MRNNGGIVIAQVKRITKSGSLKPHDVRVPGILVDYVVVDPDQKQTTQTLYDPAISGEIFRPLEDFALPDFNIQKVIARRVAQELAGRQRRQSRLRHLRQRAAHPARGRPARRGHLGDRAGRGRRRAAARLRVRLRLQCRSLHAVAATSSPISRAAASMPRCCPSSRSTATGSVNVSKLGFRPHVTAGAGGFVDITARARKIVFSGMFNAGAKVHVAGRQAGHREGRQAEEAGRRRSSTSPSPAAAPSRRARTSPMSPSAAS